MFRVFAAFTAIALLAQICVASAGDYGTRDEAVAMVKRVEDMFAKAGSDSLFKAVSDKSLATFHDRDLYPFIYDLCGRCVAHGARPALIGKNLLNLKDQDGKYLIREMSVSPAEPVSGGLRVAKPDQQNRGQDQLRRKDG